MLFQFVQGRGDGAVASLLLQAPQAGHHAIADQGLLLANDLQLRILLFVPVNKPNPLGNHPTETSKSREECRRSNDRVDADCYLQSVHPLPNLA